jgi:hypothetical protein
MTNEQTFVPLGQNLHAELFYFRSEYPVNLASTNNS